MRIREESRDTFHSTSPCAARLNLRRGNQLSLQMVLLAAENYYMTEIEWIPGAALIPGPYIHGQIRVRRKGRADTIVAMRMPARTITAFAKAREVRNPAEAFDDDDVAGQIAFAARVLKAWGKEQIKSALDAGVEPHPELSLTATVEQAQVILNRLGPLSDTQSP